MDEYFTCMDWNIEKYLYFQSDRWKFLHKNKKKNSVMCFKKDENINDKWNFIYSLITLN